MGLEATVAVFKKLGRWQDSGAGDCTGAADHVGIVVYVVGNNMKVIEGNMSNAVGYRTMKVNGRWWVR